MKLLEAGSNRWVWRATLVASGVLLAVGGGMHPGAPDDLGLRDELATMMDDSAWVPGHAFIVVSTALLALGLYWARRSGEWAKSTDAASRIAVIAVGFYVIETFFHLIAFVDADHLRDNEFAPVAYVHLGLAAVLYPFAGLAIAWLAWKLWETWSVPARVFAAAGIVGGIVHAVSVPVTLSQLYDNTSPLFAMAGVLLSVWSIALGLVGIRSTATIDARESDSHAMIAAR